MKNVIGKWFKEKQNAAVRNFVLWYNKSNETYSTIRYSTDEDAVEYNEFRPPFIMRIANIPMSFTEIDSWALHKVIAEIFSPQPEQSIKTMMFRAGNK